MLSDVLRMLSLFGDGQAIGWIALVVSFAVSLLAVVFKLLWESTNPSLADIPGPRISRVSSLWLARSAGSGKRSVIVHAAHARYGKFLRLAPNHVSIADPAARDVVLGHSTGFLKSEFYDAFVSIRRGVFNTRDRAEHTRKRKIVSHVFSQKNVLKFGETVHDCLTQLIDQWDKQIARKSAVDSDRAIFDTLPWFNSLAFDIIGTLAFGRPFGMLQTGKDAAVVGRDEVTGEVLYVEAVKVLNERGDVSATLGCLTPWMRPYAHHLPWVSQRLKSVANLAKIAISAVNHRLENPPSSDPQDLLSKLQKGKDENGEPMGQEELTAEALTQLIAGSDTTSNSSCAIFYHLAANPTVLVKLQHELDEALKDLDPLSTDLPAYDDVKALPYLEKVIDEALRIHCTSGIGLARVVPEGGATVCGRFFESGTVLSVPTYTIHRDVAAWGEDPDVFRPERWFERDEKTMQGAFMPFSVGPRGCVGRNLASMELLLIVSTLAWKFDFRTAVDGQELEVREGFLRKPIECPLHVSRRHQESFA